MKTLESYPNHRLFSKMPVTYTVEEWMSIAASILKAYQHVIDSNDSNGKMGMGYYFASEMVIRMMKKLSGETDDPCTD
jgi:hypothetical protein